MSLFQGIPAACELCCAAEHMQWPRQEDGSQLEFTRQNSQEERSGQHLTEETRELIFNKALKNHLRNKKNLSDLI